METELIPATGERVPLHTAPHVNEQIESDTQARIEYYSQHRGEIPQRLKELEQEWDTERFLETNASTLVVIGALLGFTRSKKWFLLPALVGSFLLQHAIQGWCPPLPIIRRLGFRTANEINREKMALKCLTDGEDNVCAEDKLVH